MECLASEMNKRHPSSHEPSSSGGPVFMKEAAPAEWFSLKISADAAPAMSQAAPAGRFSCKRQLRRSLFLQNRPADAAPAMKKVHPMGLEIRNRSIDGAFFPKTGPPTPLQP
jgi:hypothetical protein